MDLHTFVIPRLSCDQFRCLACISWGPPLFLALVLLLHKFLGSVMFFSLLYRFLLLSPLSHEETCNSVKKILFNLSELYYVAMKRWAFLDPPLPKCTLSLHLLSSWALYICLKTQNPIMSTLKQLLSFIGTFCFLREVPSNSSICMIFLYSAKQVSNFRGNFSDTASKWHCISQSLV